MSLPSIESRGFTRDLRTLCPDGVECHVAMRKLTRWHVGGPVDYLVTPSSIAETIGLIRYLVHHSIPWVVIGHSTNLLIADEGVRAVVVQISDRMSTMRVRDNRVSAQAGIWVPRFAVRVGKAGFAGAEHIVGIPGTLGGLVCMNGGSRRRSIGENVVRVHCVTQNGDVCQLEKNECGFSYRRSLIQDQSYTVLESEFVFKPGDVRSIRQNMLLTLSERRRKFPLKLPNCGSVFVSDPDMFATFGPPGAVIERCGLKGFRIGDAQVSPIHANFIVNLGNATAEHIICTIQHIRDTARRALNCDLKCEVRYVAQDGTIQPAHLLKARDLNHTCRETALASANARYRE